MGFRPFVCARARDVCVCVSPCSTLDRATHGGGEAAAAARPLRHHPPRACPRLARAARRRRRACGSASHEPDSAHLDLGGRSNASYSTVGTLVPTPNLVVVDDRPGRAAMKAAMLALLFCHTATCLVQHLHDPRGATVTVTSSVAPLVLRCRQPSHSCRHERPAK